MRIPRIALTSILNSKKHLDECRHSYLFIYSFFNHNFSMSV